MSTIRYISLFSGIEAATVAWHQLGWKPIAYAEIEPFPKAVLRQHNPEVPDLGDMTKVDWKQYHHAADVVVGGSPCQAFSIAGLRKALDDPRGQLMLEYLRACAEIDPEWIIWENVPGVLSAEHGRAFQSLLEAVAELWPDGGGAWRVLDAQFFGVAQRRERVFLVVNTRDWRRAAPVLFERESLCWDHQSSREKRKSLAGGTAGGVGNADSGIGNLTHGENQSRRVYSSDGIAPTLQARENDGSAVMLDFPQQDGRFKVSEHPDLSNTLTSHMGTGGNNVPLVKAFKWNQGERSRSLAIGDVSPTLSTAHNPAIYEVAGNIIGRGSMNGGHQLGVADPDENGAFTLTSTDRHAVAEIERERSDVPGGQPGERRIGLRPRADLDGALREGRADHIPIMTSNGDDVFPALCATDGSKRFIDNQSINGGRLLIDRRRT
ncbi:MAG: DNA cytosine methyltransferase [Bifidobacterium bifidum]|nr:DNA cytosine methyltransferase [Bifidobacterium bifidum]